MHWNELPLIWSMYKQLLLLLAIFLALLKGWEFSCPCLWSEMSSWCALPTPFNPTQKPLIDVHSREGLTPTNFDCTIQFNNVCFSYPTRRENQVRSYNQPAYVYVIIHSDVILGSRALLFEGKGWTNCCSGGSQWVWQEHCDSVVTEVLRCG